MLNLKKVIASICVLAMVLSTVAFGATYTDVAEDSAYYEAVETLNKLDIIEGYEDGTFKPEDGVTRAEMAALIARIQGYGATAAGSANTAFADVPSSHWASGYVANASGLGIINGYGDGTFGPDEPVLYEQAVKMIMATLGYTPFANENGGYPAGYLAAANRYNVTANVSGGAIGQEACRGTIAQLLVNALDTPLMVQSKWNTNGEVEYEIAEGYWNETLKKTVGYKTLMSENLGYVKIRGVVEANSITDFDVVKDIDTTEEPEVTINVKDDFSTENEEYLDFYGKNTPYTKNYFVGETDAEEYLGHSVIAYVKASESASEKFEIASIAIDSSRNDVLTISLDQFKEYDAGELKYYKEGASKITAVKVERASSYDKDTDTTTYTDAPLVFNGVGDFTVEDLDTKVGANCTYGGQITLIDNDDTKGYDYAFCDLAATAVVKKVTADGINFYNSAKIGGNDGSATKTLYVNPEDETKVVTILKDGEVIDYTDLNEWDVLSVYAVNDSANVIVAEVISSEVVGTVGATKTSKTSAFQTTAFKVGDVWYDVANGAYNEGLAAGVGGKFYIDEFGKIAAFIEDAALAGGAVGNYGYVLAVKADESDFGTAGCTVKVQLLTKDGIEVLSVKNNATFYKTGIGTPAVDKLNVGEWTYTKTTDPTTGAVSGTVSNDGGKYAALTHNTTGIVNKVVKYAKDGNGYLATIAQAGYQATADVKADFVAGDTNTSIAGKVEFDAENNKFKADGVNSVVDDPGTPEDESFTDADDAGYIDADAVVFVIGTPDESMIISAADLADKKQYNVIGSYATKTATDIDMLVIDYASFAGVSVTSNVAVIADYSATTDEDGLEVYAITFLQDGEENTLLTTNDVYSLISSWISVGDAVKIKTSGDVITTVAKAFDFGAGATPIRPSEAASAGAVVLTAKASDAGEEKFVGGAVTGYKDSSEEVEIGGNWYKLSRGVNFYTIDNTGRDISVKTGGTFASRSDLLYDGTNKNVDVWSADGKTKLAGNVSEATVQSTYADYVYIRTYEDKVIDVIVVKGYDVRIKEYVAPAV